MLSNKTEFRPVVALVWEVGVQHGAENPVSAAMWVIPTKLECSYHSWMPSPPEKVHLCWGNKDLHEGMCSL